MSRSYDDISPKDVYRETGRWFSPVLVVMLAVIGIALIGTLVCWRAGWWFTAQNATRQAEVIQNGYSNQSTLRAQVTSKLADVTTVTTQIAAAKDTGEITALKAQRAAIAGIICGDAAQITGPPLPPDQAQWVTANCSDGTVSPGSPLYVTGGV
jgi:branched-subunit amino acid permease